MVTIVDFPENPRDTRGLPEGYDPHNLYEYRFQRLKNEASGLEWFLYQYIPFSLVKSLAFAIDPTAAFKVAPGAITPGNRTKYRATLSVLQTRGLIVRRVVANYAQQPNYMGHSDCWSPRNGYTGFSLVNNYALASQPALADTLIDTTGRTRLMGSKQGTLTLFKGHINSPPRSVRTVDRDTTWWTGSAPELTCSVLGGTKSGGTEGTETNSSEVNGQGATLSTISHSSLRTREVAYNEALMKSNAVALLKGWSPFNRDYTLFRNVVELRDLPRSLFQLKETVFRFKQLYASLASSPSTRKIIFDLKAATRQVPGEYLSYHFGWKQTYSDIVDLLNSPAKISRKINFLMSRSNKPTNFRSKRSFVSGVSGVSGFDYETLGGEYIGVTDTTSSRIERESEVRLVINSTFDFPPIDGPRFAFSEWGKRIGAVPRVTDVYNLIPWTWLLDWFSGVGNYVELIDNINHDPSLVNWGMITCYSKGKLITERQSSSNLRSRHTAQGVVGPLLTTIVVNRHTSSFDYVCDTRRDVSTILDVNTTSEPTSLTPYQKSILGALLAQRTDFTRLTTFRR